MRSRSSVVTLQWTVAFWFLFTGIHASAAGTATAKKKQNCFAKGVVHDSQTLDLGGPPGSGPPDPKAIPCCKGLLERNSIAYCGSAMSGSAEMICISCGDKKCEAKLENSCNCLEDCPKQ